MVLNLKGDLRPKFYPYFCDIIFVILWRKSLSGLLFKLRKVIKFQNFEFSIGDVKPVNVQNIPHLVFFAFFFFLVLFYKVLCCFWKFFVNLRNYEVLNGKRDKSNVIHASEHTKHAICGLYVNFGDFLLKLLCFIMKKVHSKLVTVVASDALWRALKSEC